MIDPAAGDVAAQIKAIVPNGVDLAVEATGIPSVMADAIAVTRQQGGRAVVIGNAKAGAEFKISPNVFNQGKSLMGTWGGDSQPDRDYGRFAKLISSGRFPVRDLLSAPYQPRGHQRGARRHALGQDRPAADRHEQALGRRRCASASISTTPSSTTTACFMPRRSNAD